MTEDTLTSPAMLADVMSTPEFNALPFQERKQVVERGLSESAQWLQKERGGWTPETWQEFGDTAQAVRQSVTESETFLEKTGAALKQAGGAVKDALAITGAQVVGLSPVLPTPAGGLTYQVPGETLGPMFLNRSGALVGGVAETLMNDETPMRTAIATVKQGLDSGAFFKAKGGLSEYLDLADGALQQAAGQYHGFKDQTQQNSVLQDAENAKLVAAYLTARDPETWAALEKRLMRTPFDVAVQEDRQRLQNESRLGQALTAETRPLIGEAADPAEAAGNLVGVGMGANVLRRGVSAGQRVRQIGTGLGAEMLSEQISATMEDPRLSLAERAQVAKDSIISAAGLMGAGALPVAAVRAVDALRGRTSSAQTVDQTMPTTANDPLAQESIGDLTVDEARALTPRQPILTNVPDRVPANAPVSTPPPADQTVPDAVPTPPQTFTGSNVQTGTAMPVPPPTAAAGAGAGGISTPASPTPSTLATTTAPAPAATPEAGDVAGGVAKSSAAVSPSAPLTAAPAAVQTVTAMPVPPPTATADAGKGGVVEVSQRGDWLQAVFEGGTVSGRVLGNNLRISDENLSAEQRGKGYDTRMYQALVDEALKRGLNVQSASTVNEDTVRVYESLRRQGYQVQQNPQSFEVPGGSKALATGNDTNVFVITPTSTTPSTNPDVPQGAPGFRNLDTSGRTAGFLNTEILAEGAALIRRGVTDFTNWSLAMVQRFGAAIREFLGSIWQQIKPMAADALMNYMQRSGSIKMLSETGEMPRRVNVQNGKVQNMTTSAIDVLYQDSVALPKPTSKTSNDTVAKNLQEAAMEQWGRVITSEDIQPEEEAMIVANGVDEVLAGWGASGKTAADWYTTNVEAAMAVAEVIHDELSSDAAAQRVRVNGRQVFRNREDAKLAMYLAMAITSQNLNVNQNTTYAEEQFNLFKRNGEFDSSKVYGDKAKSISANLALANLLIRKLGWEEMYETVKADYTVKALSDLASKVTGRKVSIAGRQNDIVQGAALFGPKIGQGFLQNLMGNFYPVTIDLWMRRTWGRWTGDVLGDGITGERLAKLIDEARRIGLMLPASLARTRPVVRRTEKGKPFRTMSEDFIDRVENEEDLRDEINNYTKEVVAIWTRKYNAVQSGITQAQRASLLNGSVTMDSVADVSLRDEERLNRRWEALKNKPKGKGAKEAWKQQQRQAHGRTQVLTTDEWNGTVNGVKNAGRKLKPKWALAANVIRSQLKPLDSPSDQDRMVISRIVNKIRVELESRGVKVSNADIQAILWYPEKDLWAKLRGEQESDLKQSYEEEFVRIANQRGRGREAAEAVARVRAARAGRSNDASANGRVRNGAQAAAVEKGFRNLDASGRTGGFLNSEILAEGEALIRNGVTAFTQWSAAMVRKFGEAIREFLVSIWQQVKPLVADALMNYMQRTGSLKTVVQTNGMPQGTAPVTVGEGGFVGTGSPSAESQGANVTQARFAPPNEVDQTISGRADADVLSEAQAWLAGRATTAAVNALEAGAAGLPGDTKQRAMGLLINQLSQTVTQGDEAQQILSRTLLERMSRVWVAESNSADVARELRQRAVVNNADLVPVSAILATLQILVDRGKRVLGARFTGGEEALLEKIKQLLLQKQGDITDRVEAILNTVMGAMLRPRVTLQQAVNALLGGKTQREQIIDDVARALMQRAKQRQVTPERQTALAALVASLKRTLGAAVQGKPNAPASLSFGELLARTFVDSVAEAPLFQEAWNAGREQVRGMLIELGMTEADADTRLNELMPPTPAVAYAPGMVKQAILRGMQAAGYGADRATGTGQREVDMRAEVLQNPQRAMQAVMKVWDEEAAAAGVSAEAWARGRVLAQQALTETLQQWQEQRQKQKAKAELAAKQKILAKDSPALVKLLNDLRNKIAPGMTWTEIFTDMPDTQKDRQREIYRRLMLDERLEDLTLEERVALTNELDKAWQRERRTVFQRELQKAGVLGEKKASDRQKVVNGLPKLLRLMNLGVLTADTVREALMGEFGLRTLSAADVKRLRSMAEAAYQLPEGSLRNRALQEMLKEMQAKTGSSRMEILSNFWTNSVLSGLRTQFDTFLSVINGMGSNLMQAAVLMGRGQGVAAVQAHAQWWRFLIDGVRESGQILLRGDQSYLKKFGESLQDALQGERTGAVPVGEMLWRNGNVWQKYFMAPVMLFTGRLMAAADHINNTATTGGALAVARALNPELYEGRVAFTAAERAAARKQATIEVTGGDAPTTAEERAQISVRTREILSGTMRPEDVQAASEVGDMAAFQNDPTGLFGTVYHAMKGALGTVQRGLGEVAEDETASRFARAVSAALGATLHGLTGTRFMRFGFNFGADLTRYMPGTYLLGKAGFYGRNVSRMQQELLLGKNVVGLMLGSTLAAMFLSKDDEEEGWHIEGDWSTLTPQQQKQRMTAGLERMTMWKRENGQVQRVSYKQWPTMSLFAMVGRMLDEKRHKPEIWAQRGVAGHLLAATLTGVFQIQNVSAMQNLAQIFGQPTFAGDPAAEWGERLIKMPVNYVGGLVPTLVKDAEIWNDPRSYKPEGAVELLMRNMPVARRFVNDGRPQLNQLGEEVKLQRAPWSRAYTSVESADAHRVLGALLARGLTLPAASDEALITVNGVRAPIEALGREAVWRYEKAVGEGYRAWLASPDGQALLTMPVQQAERVINLRSQTIKRQAKVRVGY